MFRLFVADDEDELRRGICENIDWQAHDITICGQAANGLSALEQLLQLQPDVAILDIQMPAISGLDLLEAIYASIPRTRIIILSGYDDFSYAQRALRVGVVDYLLKPCRSADILKAVQRALQKHTSEDELSAAALFEPSVTHAELSGTLKAVMDGDRERLPELLGSRFCTCESPDNAKKFAYRLMSSLSFLCARQNIQPYQEPAWCREQMAELIRCTTTEEILRILLEKVLLVCDAIHPDSTENMIVRKAVAYIHEHYAEKLTLESVAAELYLNPKYLSFLFKQTTGVNFTDYILKVRLDEACRLLRDRNYKIYEVAAMVGYNDVKYFFSIFKKSLGVTPTQYRNSPPKA